MIDDEIASSANYCAQSSSPACHLAAAGAGAMTTLSKYMKRKIIYIILSFIFFIGSVTFYINTVAIPSHLKKIITEETQEFLGRKISLQDIHFNPVQGFILRGITILEKDSPDVFATIGWARAGFMYWPFLKEKKIILSSIEIRHVSFQLIHYSEDQWNFTDIMEGRSASQNRPVKVFFSHVNLKDGRVKVIDLEADHQFSELFENLNLTMNLSLTKGITFQTGFNIPQKQGLLEAHGNFQPLSRRFDGAIKVRNLPLGQYLKVAQVPLTPVMNGLVITDATIDIHSGRDWFECKGWINAHNLDMNFADNGNFRIQSILWQEALVRFEKNRLTAEGDTHLQNVAVSFPNGTILKGDFASPRFSLTASDDNIQGRGDVAVQNFYLKWLTDYELRGQLTLENMSFQNTPSSAWKVESRITGNQIGIQLPGGHHFTSDVITPVTVNFNPLAKTATVEANGNLVQSALKFKKDITITDEPAAHVHVQWNGNNDPSTTYNGSVIFKNAEMLGTGISAVEHIQGTATFKNGSAQSDRLSFEALGMPAFLTGTLENFASPHIDVKVHVDAFDLKAAPQFIPKFLTDNQLRMDGMAVADIDYRGPLGSPDDADIRFGAYLKNVSLTSGKLDQSVSGLSGRINYRRDNLSWEDLHATFDQKDYLLTGTLTDFKHPVIETALNSKDLKITTRFEYTPEVIRFTKLTGVYGLTGFNLRGTSQPKPSGKPLLNLQGEMGLNLEDLPRFIPDGKKILEPYQLAGIVNIKGEFKGDAVHWQDWQFSLTGESPLFLMWGVKLKNMKFNAVQKNNLLKPLHIWGEFYNGDFNAMASIDFAKKEMPFNLIMRVLDANVTQLKADTPFKKQSLAGGLSTTMFLDGTLSDLKNIHGKGGIEIKDGRLWELDLLKGLGGILLIPEYKDIVFTQAGMNFTTDHGIISTENLQLLSPSLSLLGKGTLDLNQDQILNLMLSPDFNANVIAGSSSLKRGTTAIITQTEKFMTVQITGTLSKPVYKVNKSPVRILQRTGGVILENVSQLFQNIF